MDVVPGWSAADGLFPLSVPRSNRTTAGRPGDHDAPVALEDLGELAKRMNVMLTCVGFVHASLGNDDEAFVLGGAWNSKPLSSCTSGNTASAPVWTACLPTHDSPPCLKKSGSNHERHTEQRNACRDHVHRRDRLERSGVQPSERLALMSFAEEEFVEVRGFEPLAFSLRTRRSTN